MGHDPGGTAVTFGDPGWRHTWRFVINSVNQNMSGTLITNTKNSKQWLQSIKTSLGLASLEFQNTKDLSLFSFAAIKIPQPQQLKREGLLWPIVEKSPQQELERAGKWHLWPRSREMNASMDSGGFLHVTQLRIPA